jgi:RNA polymerase sigma-70 factor (ECF subfamily)
LLVGTHIAMSTEPDRINPDRHAQFEALVLECEAPLLRYVLRVLNSSDAAQDVVQDTLIRCYWGWEGDLVPSPAIMSWLYRVAHNRAIDVLRRSNRREAAQEVHVRETQCDKNVDHPARTGVSEAAERASAALLTLSMREQQVVILKVYEDRSYKEISDLLHISVGNVGYILHHAMRKLAEVLGEDQRP